METNVGVQVPSSYQVKFWLVIPDAGVLAVKLMPLPAVVGIKFPVNETLVPSNVNAEEVANALVDDA